MAAADSRRKGEIGGLARGVVVGDDQVALGVVRDLIRREARVALARGSIYVTLDRLEKKGFVASAFSEPVHARGGKARRMFAIRPAGLAALRHSRRALDRLSAGTALVKP